MYLPFRKSCNKLLNVKCITLNSPIISKINSVKLINTFNNFKIIQILTVGSQIVAHTLMETGNGPNKPNTINL